MTHDAGRAPDDEMKKKMPDEKISFFHLSAFSSSLSSQPI